MDEFRKIEQLMIDIFSRDYQFALATTNLDDISNRYVDTYYHEGCFYVVTYQSSRKICDILIHNKVALTSRNLYSFQGNASNMGHPHLTENQVIREKLIQVFEKWYFKHNNEADQNMCYMKIELSKGFVHHEGKGYAIDFTNRTFNEFPFISSIEYTDE